MTGSAGRGGTTAFLTIETDALRVLVAPDLGAALVRVDAKRRGPEAEVEPVFRPTEAAALAARPFEPNTAACYPLVPWVSRLCPAVLPTSGEPLVIPPNWPGEAFPLHGWGARNPWRVLSASATAVSLALDHRGPPPFTSRLDYVLSDATLRITLAVTNRFDRAVGLGLGFHPWLPRHPGGELEAPAALVWLSAADKIPVKGEPPPPDWDFSTLRPLPARDVDNGFAAWSGRARYQWPAADGLWRLDIESDCDQYIVYAPAGRPFFCFEPTSHKPSPGQTGALDGLVMVEPGAWLQRTVCFSLTPP